MNTIYSNIVPEETVRLVQKKTLEIISDAVKRSFGPNGSITTIVKNADQNGATVSVDMTKDGHTIIESIRFLNPIERAVRSVIADTTLHIVKEVGDGTTSVAMLCKEIFEGLYNNNGISSNTSPADTIRKFSKTIEAIKKEISKKGRECTLDDIYNIALISTNNNEEASATIMQVYNKFGLDVDIDVGISNTIDNIVKEYDGMTLETGYTNMCFRNDFKNNKARIRCPKIYCFNDPIDTPEMVNMLDVILSNNILEPMRPNSVKEIIPTVIFCKMISSDTSSYFETVVKLMDQNPGQIPLLIVSDIHQDYLYEDIAKMCGAPFIKKYLDPNIQQLDIEKGLAPTLETIIDFCGEAEVVESDEFKTKVIHPAKMFDANGEFSSEYKGYVQYLETQVAIARSSNAGVMAIQKAERRLNSFKGKMVDYLVGGMTISDRNNLKSSIEDAVLNCKSAARYGVGYGANFMAFSVIYDMKKNNTIVGNSNMVFINILYDAYKRLIGNLYNVEASQLDELIEGGMKNGCPLNIRTNEFDHKVLSSIRSDIVILDAINKILMLMFTCNQYLVQSPTHNVYIADQKTE